MSRVLCSISGQPAEEPVLSPHSGAVFEKSVILRHIDQFGTDPVNDKELKRDELIVLNLNNHISESLRPNTTSIPALLKTLQAEWEMNMVYTQRLRSELHRTRLELSHSLYRGEAAVRAISRLNQQLNAARSALAGFERPDPTVMTDANADDDLTLSRELTEKIDEKGEALTAARRQRGKEAPEGDAKIAEMKTMELKSENKNLHASSPAGITCLDQKDDIIVTGGVDKKVVLYNFATDTVESTFVGHRRKITSVVLLPNQETVLSGGFEGQVRLWRKGDENSAAVFKHHQGAISDLDLHPLGSLFLSVSADGLWSLSDIAAGKPLLKKDMYTILPHPESENAYAFGSGKIHPDGTLLGMGTNGGVIYMWDLRETSIAAEFPAHGSVVSSIAFSENGYHLAAGTGNGLLKLWDLRKLQAFKTLELSNQEVKKVSFDHFGTYLSAAVGNFAKIFHVKSWNELAAFEHDDIVTGINFGKHARSFTTSSMDRKLRYFAIP